MFFSDAKIDNCKFPLNYSYDLENFTWVNFNIDDKKLLPSDSDIITVGITPILSYIAGNIQKIKLKSIGDLIRVGKSLGTIESLKYFGVIRSPFSGRIIEINDKLLANPKMLNDSPFESGWIVKMTPVDISDFKNLKSLDSCRDELLSLIKKFNVKCFKLFPDFEMYEIGTECSATLAKLDEFTTNKMQVGQVVHLVSDDPTADLELTRWTDENKQQLVEIIMEKNVMNNSLNEVDNRYFFHILVKKLN